MMREVEFFMVGMLPGNKGTGHHAGFYGAAPE